MQQPITIAVDFAKNVFEVAVSHHPGKVQERQRLSRTKFLRFFGQRQPARVLLKSCGSAHFWAREIEKLGHSPILLPAQYVRPYVQRNRTDSTGTEGLLEAFRNEEIRPVPVKNGKAVGCLRRPVVGLAISFCCALHAHLQLSG